VRALRFRNRREHDPEDHARPCAGDFRCRPREAAFPQQPGLHKQIVAETDGSMIPVVEPDAGQKDKRKGKKLSWREAKISLAHAKGAGRRSTVAGSRVAWRQRGDNSSPARSGPGSGRIRGFTRSATAHRGSLARSRSGRRAGQLFD